MCNGRDPTNSIHPPIHPLDSDLINSLSPSIPLSLPSTHPLDPDLINPLSPSLSPFHPPIHPLDPDIINSLSPSLSPFHPSFHLPSILCSTFSEAQTVAKLTEEKDKQHKYIKDLESDISGGTNNQSQLLEFTEKLTAKNAQLQSEVTNIQTMV